jgi:single-stranded DNA-binding protein
MQRIDTIGNVGKVSFATRGDEPVLNFSLAAHSKIKGKETTAWYECALWGDRATALKDHIAPGTGLFVSGFPTATCYIPKGEGAKPVASIKITVHTLEFTGAASKKAEAPAETPAEAPAKKSAKTSK